MVSNYSIRELAEEEFRPLFDRYKDVVFEGTHSYNPQDIFTALETEKIAELRAGIAQRYKLNLGMFDQDGEFVGWTWGFQEGYHTFYMVNSGVLAAHRRKGLYSALLQSCVQTLSERGFQLIYSKHCATNNAIIIPKLKAGFVIAKMELDDKHGVLVHLHFYTNADRRRIMDYRAGQLKPDDRIKAIFKI